MKAIIEKLKIIDKKLWILLGVVVFIFIFGLLISSLIYSINSSNRSYADVEATMKNAAMDYYSETENKGSLPEEGESVSVGDTVLSEGGYMKPLEKQIKKHTCTGKVTVTKKGINYIYAPYLNCGKTYKTIEFYNKVIKGAVTEGDGLYQSTNGYVFKGDNPNNYISLDNRLWRIISIDENNTMELVSTDYVELVIWDDRYNSSETSQTGYNDFAKSRFKEIFEEILKNNKTKYHTEVILPESLKDTLIPVNNCTDKYTLTQTDFSNCNSRNELNISAINASEFISASLDAECKTPKNKECQNYNYLSIREEAFTVSGVSTNNYEVFYVGTTGALQLTDANDNIGFFPVIRIPDSMMYVSGNGTKDDPYKIR